MGNALKYAYLDTRIRLMAGRLLNDPDLERLIEDHDREAEPPDWLGSAIGLDGEGIAGIDRALMPHLLHELSILLRALYREDRELLRFWARRFELANIKTLLRGRMSGRDNDTLRGELVDLGIFSRVRPEKLLLSSNTAELLRQLEHGVYADFAREVRHGLSKEYQLFTIDTVIDRYYFEGLAERARVAGDDARALVGSMIDRVNLVWLLRYRFSYELSPAQAYYLLNPASHQLTRTALLDLSRWENLEQVLESLPKPFFRMLEGARSIMEVTRRLEHHTWNTARRILYESRYNPTRALAYMILRERDLRRVRAVVRGRHLQMPPRLIRVATGLSNVDELVTGPEAA